MPSSTRIIGSGLFVFALLFAAVTPPVSAQTPLQESALDAYTIGGCAGGSLFAAACGEVTGTLVGDEQNAAAQQSSIEEVTANTRTATDAANGQLTNLAGRTQALRSGALGFVVNGASSPLGGAAGDVGQGGSSNLGAFATGVRSFGEHDRTAREDKFDFDTLGMTAGVDYRLNENMVLGIAAGVSDNDVDLRNSVVAGFATVNEGHIDTNAWHTSIYGTYYSGNFYVDVLGTYGWSDIDMTRNVIFGATTSTNAKSSTNGQTWAGEVSGGYQIELGAATVTPFARLSYLDAKIDSFTEKGGAELNLSVQSQSFDSLQSSLGVQATQAISFGWGVLLPLLRVEWLHEFQNDDTRFSAFFVNQATPFPLTVRSDKPDQDNAMLALGASAVFTQGWQGFAQYETLLFDSRTTNHIIQVGVRATF